MKKAIFSNLLLIFFVFTSSCMGIDARKNLRDFINDTDETFELLQYELSAITQALKSLEPDKPLKPTDDELVEAFVKGLNKNG